MTSGIGGFDTPLVLGGVIPVVAVAGFLVLWYDSPRHIWWREQVRRWSARLTGRPDRSWVDARLLTVLAASVIASGEVVFWRLGGFGCTPAGPPDLVTLFTAGHAFLVGGDPFSIAACGTTGNPVPSGMASVLLDALAALAGPVGVLLVWGAVSVALVPLLWALAGSQRVISTVFVLASFVYLPIVVAVDGASLALVPLTVLSVQYLAQRKGWTGAAALGGFLATGRFPALFPVLGASGRAAAHRTVAFAMALGVFAAITLATVAVYGSRFTGPVFFLQFGRVGALNYWGLLQQEGWVPPSTLVTVVQAALTFVLVGVTWAWARTGLGAVAIVLTGTVLLAQFLSFNELVFLLPVALIGVRPRWWLWGIGVVGSLAYLLSLVSLASTTVLFYALCLLLTALLLGLLVELLRSELSIARGASAGRSVPLSGPAGTTYGDPAGAPRDGGTDPSGAGPTAVPAGARTGRVVRADRSRGRP